MTSVRGSKRLTGNVVNVLHPVVASTAQKLLRQVVIYEQKQDLSKPELTCDLTSAAKARIDRTIARRITDPRTETEREEDREADLAYAVQCHRDPTTQLSWPEVSKERTAKYAIIGGVLSVLVTLVARLIKAELQKKNGAAPPSH